MSTKKRSKKTGFKFNKTKIFVTAVAVLLLMAWWAGALLFNPETSFTVLKHEYSFDEYKGKIILKGDRVHGEFKSYDNHLGIIYINFDKYIKPDYRLEDEILFKLKERDSRDWQYQQKYKSGSFENLKLFPFGFPIIENSKDKIYEFEISSLNGNVNNSIRINSTNPKYASSHFFPTREIRQNPIKYLIIKSINSITRVDFVLSSLIFALPLIYFLLLIATFKKSNFLKERFLLLVLLSIFIDVFVIKHFYVGILFALIGCFLFAIKSNRLGSSISFLIGSLLIFIWVILTFFGVNLYSEKLNIWTYFFLIVGMGQVIIENKLNLKNLNEYAYYLDMIKKYYGKVQLRK